MENLMISANAVLPMCLVMALGYGTRRLGWLRREEISTINKIAFRIFLPCLLYYNIYCSDLSGSFDPLLMAYAVGGVLLTFGLALGYTLLTEKLPERRGVLIQGMFRSNYVIMGIPVATAPSGPRCADGGRARPTTARRSRSKQHRCPWRTTNASCHPRLSSTILANTRPLSLISTFPFVREEINCAFNVSGML